VKVALIAAAVVVAGVVFLLLDSSGSKFTSLEDNGPVAPKGTHYVDVGSVGGRCDDSRSAEEAASRPTPWCTIGRALAQLPDGGTVVVRGGNYPGLAVGGAKRKNYLTLRAQKGERVSIAGVKMQDRSFESSGRYAGNASFLRFQGVRFTKTVSLGAGSRKIQFQHCEFTPADLSLKLTRDVLVDDSDFHDLPAGARAIGADGSAQDPKRRGIWNLTVRNSRFRKLSGTAVAVYWGANNLKVEGNAFDHVLLIPGRPEHVDAVQVAGGDGIVLRSNYVHDSEHGLMMKDFLPAKNVTIENNVFTRMRGWGMLVCDGYGVVRHNTVWQTGFGIGLQDVPTVPGKSRLTMFDNIIDHLNAPDRTMVARMDHNLVASGFGYPAGPHDIWPGVTSPKLPANQLPRFAAPNKGNFTLVGGSPGKGKAEGGADVGAGLR
jgi:hypothetical protein